MKLNPLRKISNSFRAILIATFALISVGTMQAANFFDGTDPLGIHLGNASGGVTGGHRNWAIFALSGGVTLTDPSANYGFPDVIGNVALAGFGNLTMLLSKIQGDVYYANGAVPAGNITGAVTQDIGYLNTGVSDALAASSAAGSQARTTAGLTLSGSVPAGILSNNTTALTLNNLAGSINGSAGQTYVLNLTDLVLSGAGAILTLNGTNTTNYVFNVNRIMSMGSLSKITLAGGLTAANVLFNVKDNAPGTNFDVTLSGGATLEGIILAPSRNVKLTGGAIVYGEVIAKSVSLSGSSHVIVSP